MLDIFEHYPTIKIYIGHHALMDVENSVKKTPRKEKTVMIIEEENSDDDVEVNDEELDDMDRLATEVYTEGKQPSDEDMPYVDEEDRRYWEGLLFENDDLFDLHLPDKQPTSGNVNIQAGAGCTSNLLQLVGVTTNNVNMEIPAETDVSECMESDDEIGSGKPNYEEFIESRDMAKPHICLGMLFASVDVFRRAVREGLAEVFKKFIPTADHRICVRHLYANFRDRGHRWKALKDKLWETVVACTKTEYLAAMEELKKIDEAAYNYLDTMDQCMWSRAYFVSMPRIDLLVNNLSESFNSYIMDARDKPLVAMIEIIRRKLMKRFQLKREGMMKYEGPICPRIQQKLEKNKEMSCECETQYASNGYYEVGYKGKRYVVSLEEMSLPDEQQWEKTRLEKVEPPFVKKAPSRPTKQRKRDPNEPRNPYKIKKCVKDLRCGKWEV
ncbi:Transposase, MuDR, plant [Fagus crenata]